MRIVKLATGLAVGYVLGSRAGREKYEQIVAGAAQLGRHPAVVQAKQKAMSALGTGSGPAATAEPTGYEEPAFAPAAGPKPRAPRRKPTPSAPLTGAPVAGAPVSGAPVSSVAGDYLA
jgi:hypothetical protein